MTEPDPLKAAADIWHADSRHIAKLADDMLSSKQVVQRLSISEEGKINPGKLRRACKHPASHKTGHIAADDAAAHAYA